ncbi:hypothetical protein C942_02231 [Photobacterium marinum]|uniref:Uncharacterized protein n=1 Tax=Photobacterium marinum TaxID=1056511 RepID=L8J733_9GAMM|nr:hypothetical protein C942_02231 [Photobacterium marinum]
MTTLHLIVGIAFIVNVVLPFVGCLPEHPWVFSGMSGQTD